MTQMVLNIGTHVPMLYSLKGGIKVLEVICDGKEETRKYLESNGIRADRYVYDMQSFEETVPFLTDKDFIVLLIHGMTSISFRDVKKFKRCISDAKHLNIENVLLLTDIPLSTMSLSYVLYANTPLSGVYMEYYGSKCVKCIEAEKNNRLKSSTLSLIQAFTGYRAKSVGVVLQKQHSGYGYNTSAIDDSYLTTHKIRLINPFDMEKCNMTMHKYKEYKEI